MRPLQKFLFRENTLVFLLSLAAISGPAFALVNHFSLADSIDAQSYMGLAHLDFDQSPVRRYRVIVPFLARGVHFLLGGAFQKIEPQSFPGDFAWSMSFFLVNNLLMAFCGVLVYRFSRLYGLSRWSALAGLLLFFTCRWTAYMAGLPVMDALYLLVVWGLLCALKSGNRRWVYILIFVGPFVKEPFILLLPVIFLLPLMPRWKTVLAFAASGLLIYTLRMLYEHLMQLPAGSGNAANVQLATYLNDNLAFVLNFRGLYAILSVPGFWLVFMVLAGWVRGKKSLSFKTVDRLQLLFMGSIVAHIFLSGGAERMAYLGIPLLCMWLGKSFEVLREAFAHQHPEVFPETRK